MKIFKTHLCIYTFYGAAFGLMFPIISTIIYSFYHYNYFSLETALNVQANNPLLWVINTAPFFLGLFAGIGGIRQDRIQATNALLTKEVKERLEIEKQIRFQNDLMKDDIEYARLIQLSYLPKIPQLKSVSIDYRFLPVMSVGGDLLSLVEMNEGALGIFLADVEGHGVSAALITSILKIESDRACSRYGMNPDLFMTYLNNDLIKIIPENMYLTAIYAFLKEVNGIFEFTFSRAGHPYPVLWKKNTGRSELLLSEGVPVCFSEITDYEAHSIYLEQGDRVYLFTDGMIEDRNSIRKLTGFNDLILIIDEVNSSILSVSASLDHIINKLGLYTDGAHLHDDRIIIGFEIC